jgi:hypothetical protein
MEIMRQIAYTLIFLCAFLVGMWLGYHLTHGSWIGGVVGSAVGIVLAVAITNLLETMGKTERRKCPVCNSTNIEIIFPEDSPGFEGEPIAKCLRCGHEEEYLEKIGENSEAAYDDN